METYKERDWTGLLQMLGLTLLLITVGLWQLMGAEKITFVIYMAGCFSLFCASLAAIRAGSAFSRCWKNTLFLLVLELVSGFYLYANAREVVAATGYHKMLILAGGLIAAVVAQVTQLFLVRPKWTLSKARAVEILLVVALCVIFGFLLNIECFNTWTHWDNHDYFRAIEKLSAKNIFQSGSNGLIICGHSSVSYGLWSLLFKVFLGFSTVNGLYLSNMVLIAVDFVLLYLIFKILIPRKNVPHYVLFATTATVAPWIFGSVSGLNSEHLMLTGMLLLLYAVFRGNRVLSVFSIFVICGARETGVAVAAIIVFLELVYELAEHIKGREKLCATDLAYYAMCLFTGVLGLLQLVNSGYVSESVNTQHRAIDGGPWNQFSFSWPHIRDTMREAFLGNFRWILSALILVAAVFFIVQCIRKKNKLSKVVLNRAYVIVICALLVYIVEQCSFVTFNLPRYYTLPSTLLCILAICVLQYLTQYIKYGKFIGTCASVVLALLLLIQSYTTIDPLMAVIDLPMQTGKSIIAMIPQREINHVNPSFSDPAVYNRQEMYYLKAIDKAYAAIDTADNGFQHTQILCSNEYVIRKKTQFSLAQIWGYGYNLVDPPMYGHWNREGGYRYLSYEPPEHSIDPAYVGADTDLTDILNSYEHVYYIEMPWWDTVIGPLQERYPSTKLFDTIEYHGWVLNIYQIQ